MTTKPSAETEAISPRSNPDLLGQETAEAELLRAYASGRLPHAWLIAGQGGIGKATLAFRFARFLLSGGSPHAGTLAIDDGHPVFRRVASGGHADLTTIEKQFDEEKGKQRKEIAVDDVRRIAPFLRLTPAEGGWRVVIVDGAETMNRFGQNAVLKILEEPPRQSVLMLVTERPASLLPTIRSRCRVLAIPPLTEAVVETLIFRHGPDIDATARIALARVSGGSIGRALDIAQHDGLSLLSQFLTIAAGSPIEWQAAHALGDKLAPAAADESFRSFAQLLVDWLARIAREIGRSAAISSGETFERVPGELALIKRLMRPGRLEQLLEVWEKVSNLFARSESANLDRRLTVISAFEVVSAALR